MKLKFLSTITFGIIVLALDASIASAQAPANVLAGKTCQGTLTTGPGADEQLGQGAVFIRFVGKDGAIDPDLRVNMGRAAFENPLVEIPPAKTQKLKNFSAENTTAGVNIKITGQSDGKWDLLYTATKDKLAGKLDPRSNPDRAHWKVAMVDLDCGGSSLSVSPK